MFVQTVGILTVASVGGPTAWLSVRDAIRCRSEYSQKRFRVHRPCPDLHVVRLLQHAALPDPELRQLQNQILKCDSSTLLRFYFSFQVASKSSRVFNFLSPLCSIQSRAASRSSLNVLL